MAEPIKKRNLTWEAARKAVRVKVEGGNVPKIKLNGNHVSCIKWVKM